MKRINLSNGLYTIVDDEDYDNLNVYKWHVNKSKNTFYVITSYRENNKMVTIKMHRIIINAPKGYLVDHINHNGLDNRKCNLRICTDSQNSQNRSKTYGYSKYKGVSINISGNNKYWRSYLNYNKKRIVLGTFPYTNEGEINAAKAYDKKALELFGEFAYTNFGNVAQF